MNTSPIQTSRFAQMMEEAAGYHPPAPVGTVYMLFGHCAYVAGHERCPEMIERGPTRYACNCPCHRPLGWDDGTQGDYNDTFWED